MATTKTKTSFLTADFDPADHLVDYTDEITGEVKKRLPFAAQMTWFRSVYPSGKVDVTVVCDNAEEGRFVARAKVYSDFNLPDTAYLASAEQSRRFMADNPRISPRVAAETAAVSLALRYAGFGCQFDLAGDEPVADEAPVETKPAKHGKKAAAKEELAAVLDDEEVKESTVAPAAPAATTVSEETVSYEDMDPDDALRMAFGVVVPNGKYAGLTLGEIAQKNQGYLKWVVDKFSGEETNPVYAACKYIAARAIAG